MREEMLCYVELIMTHITDLFSVIPEKTLMRNREFFLIWPKVKIKSYFLDCVSFSTASVFFF